MPTTSLQPGSTNTTAVKQLQDWLVSQGYMTPAQKSTGYGTYGPQTTAAVLAYQKAKGVDYSSGPGDWGPKTIAAAQGTSSSSAASAGTQSGVMTPAQQAAYYAQEGPKANPMLPADWLAQQNGSGAAASAPTDQSTFSLGASNYFGDPLVGKYADGTYVYGKPGDYFTLGTSATGHGYTHVQTLNSPDELAYLHGGSFQSASATPPATDPSTMPTTGDPQMDAVQEQLKTLADQLAQNGQLPANLQVTPELTGKFLSWAHSVVDPQTQQLLASKAADINASLKNAQTQFDTQQGQILQDFGTGLATEQNTAGNTGTAFSGQRALNENNMVRSTNRSIASLASNTATNVGNTLRAGAADLGLDNTNMFSVPTISSAQVSNEGGQRGTIFGSNPLDYGYDPSLYKVGNIGSSQAGALASKEGDYLDQYMSLAAKNPTRSMDDLTGMITNKPSGVM